MMEKLYVVTRTNYNQDCGANVSIVCVCEFEDDARRIVSRLNLEMAANRTEYIDYDYQEVDLITMLGEFDFTSWL